MPTAAELLEALETEFPNTVQQRVRTFNLKDSYKTVAWVYAAVNLIADSVAGVEFFFGRKDGTGKVIRIEELSEPAYYCFYPPRYGEIFTLSEMIKMLFLHLGLFGEAFLLLEKKGKVPTEVDIINPLNITPNLSTDGRTIKSWRVRQQTPGGQVIEKIIPLTDIVQWKYPNPYNKFRGMAPLTAARLSIEQDLNMSTWNAGFFQNGIRNPIALMLKQTFNAPQREEYMKRLKQNFMGFSKGQLPLLVEGGVDVRVLSNTMKDLDFANGKELTREELAAVYGTPPALIGIYRYANYSNVKEQTKIFYDTALKPKMVYFRDLFQQAILDAYFPGVICDWEWDGVEAFKEDPSISATVEATLAGAAQTYWNMGYTSSQIAQILKKPELDPMNLIVGTPSDPEIPEPEVPKSLRPPKFSHSRSHIVVYASREFYKGYAAQVQDGVLRRNTLQLAQFARSYVDQALKTLKSTDLRPEFWKTQWEKGVLPILEDTLREGTRSAYSDLKKPCPDQLTVQLDAASTKVLEIGPALTKLLSVRRKAKDSTEAVESLVSRSLPILAGNTPVSKTLHRLFNLGRSEAMKDLGVDEVAWCSCDEHSILNGTVVALGETFPGTDETYPGEAGESCTCTLFPSTVRKPEEKVRIRA